MMNILIFNRVHFIRKINITHRIKPFKIFCIPLFRIFSYTELSKNVFFKRIYIQNIEHYISFI